MESVFALMNSMNVTMLETNGVVYYSFYPKDSIPSLTNYLDSKRYLDTLFTDTLSPTQVFKLDWGVSVTSHGDTLQILPTLLYMDHGAQNDWITTKQQLQLTENTGGGFVYVYLKVPVGKEIQLSNEFNRNPIVSWSQLNYVEQL